MPVEEKTAFKIAFLKKLELSYLLKRDEFLLKTTNLRREIPHRHYQWWPPRHCDTAVLFFCKALQRNLTSFATQERFCFVFLIHSLRRVFYHLRLGKIKNFTESKASPLLRLLRPLLTRGQSGVEAGELGRLQTLFFSGQQKIWTLRRKIHSGH